jgi:RNA polymerase sigma-70 factor (ECF subfamily)
VGTPPSAKTPDAGRAALAAALQRVAQRDPRALEEVYKRTSAKLFGVCLRILNDRAEAEDVLQDVYITVWNKAGQFEMSRASPITWLAALARNRAIDRRRATGGRSFTTDDAALDIPDPNPSALGALEESEDAARLQACIGELEPEHADAIRTAFFGGLTYEALAQKIGAPLGTVKGWIRRSLLKLRACLDGGGHG